MLRGRNDTGLPTAHRRKQNPELLVGNGVLGRGEVPGISRERKNRTKPYPGSLSQVQHLIYLTKNVRIVRIGELSKSPDCRAPSELEITPCPGCL